MPTPTPRILPEHIAAEQPVIHPALDWRDDTLLMGVNLAGGERAALTSRRQILGLDQLASPICERARNFSRSPVTEGIARRFLEDYGAPTNPENAYALVNVPVQLASYYRRFIVFSQSWWPEVLALWTLGTYVYPIFSAYPYLRISSPEPGCGKSLLGQIIANLAFNGELMVSPTEANIFRLAESERGTQVWDEVENDHYVEQSRLQAMRSALLNGYRAGGVVPRQERASGGQYTTVRYHVYVPRVLIGLSDLPAVVQQRVIELTLQRRSSGESVERYWANQREGEEANLRGLCALYALRYCADTARQYRREDLVRVLEQHLGQAGRLTDDLLLPLFAVGAAPLDNDPRSRNLVLPILRTIFEEAVPELSHSWNETATTTPQWLLASLDALEQAGEITPTDLADIVSRRTGGSLSAEQLSRQLSRYGIHSIRRGGRRLFSLSSAEIAQLRARYRARAPEEESAPTSPQLPSAAQTGQ